MLNHDIQPLMLAVRRHLWRGHAAAAVRLASWATAALAMLAAGAQLAAPDVSAGGWLVAAAATWLALLLRAAARRPCDRVCALWADRHLGGESAFTTLFDAGGGGGGGSVGLGSGFVARDGSVAAGAAQAPAVRWLVQWATARAPHSLAQLATRRDPAHLAQLAPPLWTMAVCVALAALVLNLPGMTLQPAPLAAAVRPDLPEASLHAGDGPNASTLAAQIANALRATPDQPADMPAAGARPPGIGPHRADNTTLPTPPTPPTLPTPPTPPTPVRAGAMPAGAGATGPPVPAGGVDAATAPGARGATPATASFGSPASPSAPGAPGAPSASRAPGAPGTAAHQPGSGGAGRQVGDSADTRTAGGAPLALRVTMAVQGVALAATRGPAQRQANDRITAGFDGDPDRPEASRLRDMPEPAAATPPPATASTRLTAPETGYVQAWMKASPARR